MWYWKSTGLRIRGLNLALGTASNSPVTLAKATSHAWTHFVPVFGTLACPGYQKRWLVGTGLAVGGMWGVG